MEFNSGFKGLNYLFCRLFAPLPGVASSLAPPLPPATPLHRKEDNIKVNLEVQMWQFVD